jgi:hypothetical protein
MPFRSKTQPPVGGSLPTGGVGIGDGSDLRSAVPAQLAELMRVQQCRGSDALDRGRIVDQDEPRIVNVVDVTAEQHLNFVGRRRRACDGADGLKPLANLNLPDPAHDAHPYATRSALDGALYRSPCHSPVNID